MHRAPQCPAHGPTVVPDATSMSFGEPLDTARLTAPAAGVAFGQSCSRYRRARSGGSSPARNVVTRHWSAILTAYQAPLSSRPCSNTHSPGTRVRTLVTGAPQAGHFVAACGSACPAAGVGGRAGSASTYQSSGWTARRSGPVNSSTVHCCANRDINGAPILSFNTLDRRFVVKMVRRSRSSR